MKKNSFRLLSLILALALIVTSFASCKKNDDEQKPEKPNQVEGPPEDQEIVDLDLYIEESITSAEESVTGEPNSEESTENSKDDSDTTPSKKPTQKPTTPSTEINTEGMSQNDIINLVRVAGYEYDAEQKVFYSVINPWQRHMGFSPIYDLVAPQAKMTYKTIRVDFKYNNLLWRIQCWKGQYGVLAGAEMGVYTKDPATPNDGFYECADDEHLMEMQFKFYKTTDDFNKRNMAFERKLQEHWWLTGFQFGHCIPRNCVLDMLLVAYDDAMADGIEAGLQQVTDEAGIKSGFVKYEDRKKWDTDFYLRDGKKFRIVWVNAGFDNYDAESNKRK